MIPCETCPYGAESWAERKESMMKYCLETGDSDWQSEYTYCDKVGGRRIEYGFCSDCDGLPRYCWEIDEYLKRNKAKPKQDTEPKPRYYRTPTKRHNARKHKKRLKKLFRNARKNYWIFMKIDYDNPDSSVVNKSYKLNNKVRFMKNYYNRRIRRHKGELPNGHYYRKYNDSWEIFD
jgi:hypothetical protein